MTWVQTVVETKEYLAAAKRAQLDGQTMYDIVTAVAATPDVGDLIEGSGGYRKFRFARPGTGKSGGFRVVSLYVSSTIPVFLITVFAKSRIPNLSKAQRTNSRRSPTRSWRSIRDQGESNDEGVRTDHGWSTRRLGVCERRT
jgi:hypothetical protein